MEKRSKNLPQIVRLWAKNFRSLEDVDVKLGPLTVLVGPNASGKSNVVDVLRFVSDAFRNGLDRAIADRHGIGAIRRWSKGRPYDVEIGLEFQLAGHALHYGFVLGSKLRGEYQVKEEHIRVEGDRRSGRTIISDLFEVRNGRLVAPKPEGPVDEAILRSISSNELIMLRHWLWLVSPPGADRSTEIEMRLLVQDLGRYLFEMRFYHLFPNEIRQPQKLQDPYRLEEDGGNLASVLRRMIRGNSEYLPDLRDAMGKAVPGVADFQVTQVGAYLVVKLKHQVKDSSGRGTWFDLTQESDGTLRILALLAALFQDPPPSFLAVEEPELTVHPGALAVLADYLKEAALRTQILITTHSPELIDGLPIESLRAVESVDGVTKVGMVAEHQREAVRNELFSPGDLHRMEGLQLSAADRQ